MLGRRGNVRGPEIPAITEDGGAKRGLITRRGWTGWQGGGVGGKGGGGEGGVVWGGGLGGEK